MGVKEEFKGFSKLYLLTLAVTLAILTLGALIYATFMNKPILETLRWALIIGTFILLVIGFVSLFPFSEYRYLRGAALNPITAREGMKHIKAGRESKRMGIILGLVGFTLLLFYFIIFQ